MADALRHTFKKNITLPISSRWRRLYFNVILAAPFASFSGSYRVKCLRYSSFKSLVTPIVLYGYTSSRPLYWRGHPQHRELRALFFSTCVGSLTAAGKVYPVLQMVNLRQTSPGQKCLLMAVKVMHCLLMNNSYFPTTEPMMAHTVLFPSVPYNFFPVCYYSESNSSEVDSLRGSHRRSLYKQKWLVSIKRDIG